MNEKAVRVLAAQLGVPWEDVIATESPSQAEFESTPSGTQLSSATFLALQLKGFRGSEETAQANLASLGWEERLHRSSSGDRLQTLIAVWDEIPPPQRPEVLTSWWSVTESAPRGSHREIVRMFREVGYVGENPKPSGPQRFFRGIQHHRERRGLSWTADVEIARFFVDANYRSRLGWVLMEAGRSAHFDPLGQVVTVVASPDAILAGFTDRDESEYILDPSLYGRTRWLEWGAKKAPQRDRSAELEATLRAAGAIRIL